MKKNNKLLYIGSALTVLVIATAVILMTKTESGTSKLIKRGTLVASVSGRGEVQGEKSVRIELADVLQDNQLRVWSFKINDLIPEGKKVKKVISSPNWIPAN